jgi:hypothetical protein
MIFFFSIIKITNHFAFFFLGDIIDSPKLIVPDDLYKIHLTPARSKFIVIGTKDSIFNWMKSYGNVVCKFDQQPPLISHPKLSQKFTTKNHFKILSIEPHKMLKFELYDEDRCEPLFKRLFSSSKMKLEIKVNNKNQPSSKYMEASSVMSISGENGIRLQEVLMAFRKNPSRSKTRKCYDLSSDQLARVNCDFE